MNVANGPQESGAPETLTVALFGVGRAGSIHFKNLIFNPRCQFKYIVELDTTIAEKLVMKYHLSHVKVVSADQADTVYKDPSVDGVIVCSLTHTHDEIVQKSLQHGKAVFCEKPLSDTPEGIISCYDAAEKAKKPLLCSFNRRFDPSVRGIRNRVSAGEIGKVHVIKTCSRDHPLPAMKFLSVSGGMFHDCAVHDLDMVCWIVGEYPVSVYVQATVQDPGIAELKDVDTVLIILKFASGILSVIDLSRHSSYGYDQRIEVNGGSGMLTSENHVPNGVVQHNKNGVQGSVYKHSFPQRYAESYVNAIEHFFDLIQGTAKEDVSKTDAVNVCQLADACEESHRTGLPVTVKYK